MTDTDKKIYFSSAEKMKSAFAAIMERNPAMAQETAFHDFFFELAGNETNSKHVVLMITIALQNVKNVGCVNLAKYIEAVLDDAQAIDEAKENLEDVAEVLSQAKKLVLPEFPQNTLGIKRGTILRSNDIIVEEQLGVKVGKSIPIGYDGKYVRCGPFDWSIEQLVNEILAGYWEIAGSIDLSNPVASMHFAQEIERIKVRMN